jgi:hypothetical protein
MSNKRIKKKQEHYIKCKIKKLSPTKDDVVVLQIKSNSLKIDDISRIHSILHDILGDRKFIVFPDNILTVENITVEDRKYYADHLRSIADYLDTDGGNNENKNS